MREQVGFAEYLRQALPNATFVGFTGTPIEEKGRNTEAVFGEVIDTYDMTQAVADKATVPIHYTAPLAKLRLDLTDDERAELDALAGYRRVMTPRSNGRRVSSAASRKR